jgi:hypothetical protein
MLRKRPGEYPPSAGIWPCGWVVMGKPIAITNRATKAPDTSTNILYYPLSYHLKSFPIRVHGRWE